VFARHGQDMNEDLLVGLRATQPYLLGEISAGPQEAAWFNALKLLKDSRPAHPGFAVEEGFLEPAWTGSSLRAVAARTTAFMQLGAPWIKNGILMGDQMLGMPPLLHKVDDPLEGPAQYMPYVFRHGDAVTDADVLELTAYGLLLGELQGHFPAKGGVCLRSGEVVYIDLPEHLPRHVRISDQLLPVIQLAA
jgi:hypothetical protein